MSAAFYCVADSSYFLGAVGLVNSLRLVGHREPIHLLDCGLSERQRELLAPEVELVAAPDGRPPWLLKTVAPLAHPSEITVLIDADMIATRPLTELIDRAASGRVVGFRDRQQRFCPEWAELGVGVPEHGAYVTSGLMFLGGATGRLVLELLDRHQPSVDFERTFWRRNDLSYPFRYADQDVVNAILAARVDPPDLDALDERLAATPPFRGLRIVDPPSLECRYPDGSAPFAVHQYVRKPWLERTYDGVYSRLLRRLLTGDDVAVRPPAEWVPRRLRAGARAALGRGAVNVLDAPRWHLGDRLPSPLGRRVEGLRRRRAAR